MIRNLILLILGLLPSIIIAQTSETLNSPLLSTETPPQEALPNNVLVANQNVQAYGQTRQGRFVLSGSSELNCSSHAPTIVSDDISQDGNAAKYSFNFSPELSYFVIDNLAAGIFVDYTSTEYGEFKQNNFNAGPRITYFFGKGMVKPYLKSDLYFGSTTFDNYRYRIFGFGSGGGAVLFITSTIALNVGVSYSYKNYTNVNNSSAKKGFGGVDTDLGISLYF